MIRWNYGDSALISPALFTPEDNPTLRNITKAARKNNRAGHREPKNEAHLAFHRLVLGG